MKTKKDSQPQLHRSQEPSGQGFELDRIVREDERKLMTGISRAHVHELEKAGLFPKRVHLSARSIGWRLSDIKHWLANLPASTANATHTQESM